MKRAAGDGFGDRDGKKGRLSRYGQNAFKVLCPEPMVASLMGNKGGEIHSIEDQTSTHLQFSPRGEFYPDTRYRILTVCGTEPGFIFDALMVMVDQIVARGQDEPDARRSAEFVDQSGRIVFRCALSKPAAGAIIGSKGERIRRLRESSGAHIDIDREVVDSHQLVTVSGSREQLTAVIEELNSSVQLDAHEDWFQQWAGQRQIAGGAGGGGAGSGGGGGSSSRGERCDRGGGERGGGPRGSDRGGGDDGGRRRSHDTLRHKGCTIFVGRLAQATSTDSLSGYFTEFGEVIDSDVRSDPTTGRSKGFGFITFADPGSVEACLDRKADHEIDGRWVDVKRYGESDGGAADGDAPADDRFDDQLPPPASHHEGGGGRAGSGGGGGGGSSGPRVGDRFGDRDDHRGPPRGNGYGKGGDDRGSVAWFNDLAVNMNPDYLGLNYCINCSLPSAKCGALIGRRGEHITEVQHTTGAEIIISKKEPNEPPDAHRTVTITGPLLSVYGAHALLMRHYNDEEAQFQARVEGGAGGSGGGAAPVAVEDLQRKLAALQEELEAARGHGGGGGHYGGKGGGRGPGPSRHGGGGGPRVGGGGDGGKGGARNRR